MIIDYTVSISDKNYIYNFYALFNNVSMILYRLLPGKFIQNVKDFIDTGLDPHTDD